MANIERHPKHAMERIDQADFSIVPTGAGATRLVERYVKDGQDQGGRLAGEEAAKPVILRLEDVPATPRNLERIRARIRLLNRRLEDSGTPFRFRLA